METNVPARSVAGPANPTVSKPEPLVKAPAVTPSMTPGVTTSPTTAPPPTSSAKGAIESHKVQPGDSFASLAQNYYGTEKLTKFLIASNPEIRDPNRLTVGMVVKIPPTPPDAASAVVGTTPPHPSVSNDGKAAGGKSYRVQPGDTFYSIAKKELGDSARWKELFVLNKEAVNGDATQLQIGQVLKLPEKKQ
jgi:nucleoid-associated protein YgaU